MAIKAQVNTFTGGMDLDTDVTLIKSDRYREAENIRVITNVDSNSGALRKVEDLTVCTNNEGIADTETILGATTTQYYSYDKTEVEEVGILLTKETVNNVDINNLWMVSDFSTTTPKWKRIVSCCMDITGRVSLVTDYESMDVSYVYISDGESLIKAINICDTFESTKENPLTDPLQFDIHKRANLDAPYCVGFGSGGMVAGAYQYAFRLKQLNAGTSAFSTPSSMIFISDQDYNEQNTFKGSEKEDKTGLSVKLKLTYFNSGFYNYLQIIRIAYASNTATPDVSIVDEIAISQEYGNATVEYEDPGNSAITKLTIDEFRGNLNLFSAVSICKLFNILFASNIKEKDFDVVYDARAYRANKNGEVKISSALTNDVITTTIDEIKNGTTVIPDEFDCINPMNNIASYPYDTDQEYAFNGNVRGGAGINVSYHFVVGDLVEDSYDKTVSWYGTYVLPRKVGLSYKNYSISNYTLECPEDKSKIQYPVSSTSQPYNYRNPYIAANFTGYMRDEIYRFGIVFFNEQGVSSPVHWIGDVRFPAVTVPGYETFDTFKTSKVSAFGKPLLLSHPLGISFTIKNLPSEVKSYQIVRCRRTLSDKTVLMQGLLSRTVAFSGWKHTFLKDGLDAKYSYEPQSLTENADRRSALLPTFTSTKNAFVIEGSTFGATTTTTLSDPHLSSFGNLHQFAWQNGGLVEAQDEGEEAGDYSAAPYMINKLDSDGVLTFVSPDISFNYNNFETFEKAVQKIVPIFGVASPTACHHEDDDCGTMESLSVGAFGSEMKTNVGSFPQFNRDFNYNVMGMGLTASPQSVVIDGKSVMQYSRKNVTYNTYGPDFVVGRGYSYSKYKDDDRGGRASATGVIIPFYVRYGLSDALKDGVNSNVSVKIKTAKVARMIESQYANNWTLAKTSGITLDSKYFINQAIGGYETVGSAGRQMVIYAPDFYKSIDGVLKVHGEINDSTFEYSQCHATVAPLIANIKTNNTPYGGSSYSQRSFSTYQQIVQKEVNTADNVETVCFGGDTYITVYEHQQCAIMTTDSYTSPCITDRPAAVIQFPVESTINTYYRYDDVPSQFASVNSTNTTELRDGYYNPLMRNEAGSTDYGNITSIPPYSINSQYVTQDNGKIYQPMQIGSKQHQHFGNRIVASEVKTNGELTNSWMTFKFANYIDVDTDFGEITNLHVFRNQLYYFQNQAVGVASVNERSLISDGNANAVQLGSGTVLQRYDYKVVTNGDAFKNDKSITHSEVAMYFYDPHKKVICAISDTFHELSKEKQVQNYVNNLHDTETENPISFVDKQFNEVWIRLDNKRSLCYNELLNAFTSFYTHVPNCAFVFSNRVVSITKDNKLYIHNMKYNGKEDDPMRTAKIQFVVNNDLGETKVFDNVRFEGTLTPSDTFQARLADGEVTDETEIWQPAILKNIWFKTKTQTTDSIDYKSIENREDSYRFYIPRESRTDDDNIKDLTFSARMRGKYMQCNYTFDCNDGAEFVIPYIMTTYRNSAL